MLEGERAGYKTAMRFLELRQESVVVVMEEDRKQCDKSGREMSRSVCGNKVWSGYKIFRCASSLPSLL
jgi:hypothetical protein